MNLQGTTALVTGAASGLGAATATLLAERGATVIGIDLAAAIERAGEQADGIGLIAADVTDEAAIRTALGRVDGARPLRLAVNCAGIGPAERILSSKGTHDLELFRRTLDVNLVGTFNVLRLAAETMAGQAPDACGDRGVIVNTASIAAFEGQVGQVAYSASKAGVVGMTITAARDLARNRIRVCTIAPGIVDTPMLAALGDEVREALEASIPHPQRLAEPAEYAKLVAMIAEHDYLNGETIRMDGALRMPPQ
ncbi:3-hydroxy-2-methylbutyryl-CoA dehydrogenase [Pseudoclavibacter endophyticus]|uniref:SDR family NAD(P)-dependent oxidoreductase n=1 Tax=Pseudoclavibacter endophyticus TaxID=1778590 RepID=A0A6H9WT65_9MICO|nr:SDR family NAD(P)-dependent oxidoreductase [Pseudoclavibacter endophyticus]KAB1649584.1 SDR family NAD(P)-dependent oxidoreductase [Pseudoclavibacter endophyticus]GGA61450.1 3-hydroxy-2-methylbutyryl-CoA dehydrogenase [Pseudoclavibacter endophyticus]